MNSNSNSPPRLGNISDSAIMVRESIESSPSEGFSILKAELDVTKSQLSLVLQQNKSFNEESEREKSKLQSILNNHAGLNATLQSELDSLNEENQEKMSEILYLQRELELAASEKSEMKSQINELETFTKELELINNLSIKQQAALEKQSLKSSETIKLLKHELGLVKIELSDTKATLADKENGSKTKFKVTQKSLQDLKDRIMKMESFTSKCNSSLESYLTHMSSK